MLGGMISVRSLTELCIRGFVVLFAIGINALFLIACAIFAFLLIQFAMLLLRERPRNWRRVRVLLSKPEAQALGPFVAVGVFGALRARASRLAWLAEH
jgi:hypothetical protein